MNRTRTVLAILTASLTLNACNKSAIDLQSPTSTSEQGVYLLGSSGQTSLSNALQSAIRSKIQSDIHAAQTIVVDADELTAENLKADPNLQSMLKSKPLILESEATLQAKNNLGKIVEVLYGFTPNTSRAYLAPQADLGTQFIPLDDLDGVNGPQTLINLVNGDSIPTVAASDLSAQAGLGVQGEFRAWDWEANKGNVVTFAVLDDKGVQRSARGIPDSAWTLTNLKARTLGPKIVQERGVVSECSARTGCDYTYVASTERAYSNSMSIKFNTTFSVSTSTGLDLAGLKDQIGMGIEVSAGFEKLKSKTETRKFETRLSTKLADNQCAKPILYKQAVSEKYDIEGIWEIKSLNSAPGQRTMAHTLWNKERKIASSSKSYFQYIWVLTVTNVDKNDNC